MKRNVMVALGAAAAVVGGGVLVDTAVGLAGEADEHARTALPAAHQERTAGGDAARDDTHDGAEASTSPPRRAVATATAAVPGAVTGVELEADDGRVTGWEVDVWGDDERWHRVLVSQDGSRVLATGPADDDRDEDRAVPGGGGVGPDEAISAAEEHTGAALREAELGETAWQVELRDTDGTEYELAVDATTGEVTREDRDDDHDGTADRDEDGDDRDDEDD